MTEKLFYVAAALLVVMFMSCTQHKVEVEPIKSEHVVEVKPMEMTINVNVNVRVDKALDDFFGDIDGTRDKTDKESPAAK
jgi:hypothetical protein